LKEHQAIKDQTQHYCFVGEKTAE